MNNKLLIPYSPQSSIGDGQRDDSSPLSPAKPRSPRASRGHMRALVEAWQASGLSAPAFAEGRNVLASDLYRWKRILGDDDGPESVRGPVPSLLPVRIHRQERIESSLMESVGDSEYAGLIVERGSLRVSLPTDASLDSLRCVLETLACLD